MQDSKLCLRETKSYDAEITNPKRQNLGNELWLPDMDLNHDKQIQSLLCYRYTIGHAGAWGSVCHSHPQSSFRMSAGQRVQIVNRKS